MQKGITLVETIVAVTVLIMAMGGPFLMAARSLKTAGYAREEIVASRLAEEGLEVVHSIRDNNAAEVDAGVLWNQSLTGCTNGCIVDVTKQLAHAVNTSIWKSTGYGVIVPCAAVCAGEEHRVYVNDTNGFYRQFNTAEYSGIAPGYSKTKMTRMIKITPVSGATNREYLVESIVTYYAGSLLKTIKINDTIMNWFPSMNTLL